MTRTEQRGPPRRKRKLHAHPVRGLERMVLGIMMTVVAWVVERRLLKALKKGGQPLKSEGSGGSPDHLHVAAR